MCGDDPADLGPAADPLAEEEDDAVDDEEGRGRERPGKDDPERVLEEQSDEPGRDGRHDEQPAEALVGRLDAACPHRRDQAADDPRPGRAVEEERASAVATWRPTRNARK
jgi:hypothetical protein